MKHHHHHDHHDHHEPDCHSLQSSVGTEAAGTSSSPRSAPACSSSISTMFRHTRRLAGLGPALSRYVSSNTSSTDEEAAAADAHSPVPFWYLVVVVVVLGWSVDSVMVMLQ